MSKMDAISGRAQDQQAELMGFPTQPVTVPTFAGPHFGLLVGVARVLGMNSGLFRELAVADSHRAPWYTCCSMTCVPMTPKSTISMEEMLNRVKGEFLEMPGLRLTEPQARRLWGLDAASCSALLRALVEAQFLFRTRDGAFMRVEHAALVKASLRSRKKSAAA